MRMEEDGAVEYARALARASTSAMNTKKRVHNY